MVCRITTFSFEGIVARPVDVQVHLAQAVQPGFTIVGLPDKAVGESRERVRAAFSALGLAMPARRITVNLAPADLPKEGSHYDLAIALATLAGMGVIPGDSLDGYAAMGELALDGGVQPTMGILPAAIQALAMELRLICPQRCGSEAAWSGPGHLAADSLMSLINYFHGRCGLDCPATGTLPPPVDVADLRDVKGQEGAKRVLEIAAAGGHNLLFCGPPGSGKSMLAQRLPGLLPPLSAEELLEVSQIQSVAGLLEQGTLSRARPFRAPHHSASMPALVGGGARIRPGEISLAHNGVLFLDELPEFSVQALDSLRQPLEEGQVTISRASGHVRYPARFQLVAAMNPCRCGGGDLAAACHLAPGCIQKYQARLSGPLLDRIDLFYDTPPVSVQDLTSPCPAEGSEQVRARIAEVRQVQRSRWNRMVLPSGKRPVNADLEGEVLLRETVLDDRGRAFLSEAVTCFGLSARAYFRILKVARTIADLDACDRIGRQHLAEALSYRRRPAVVPPHGRAGPA